MSKFLTRIQSRLSRKGIKVSLSNIREKYLRAVVDPEKPTEEELAGIVELFEAISSLPVPQTFDYLETVAKDDNEDSTAELVTVEKSELVSSAAQGEDDNGDSKAKLVTVEKSELVSSTAQGEDDNGDSKAKLVTVEKSELVSSTAQSLGVVLNTQEILSIADSINYSSDDLFSSLNEIKVAIVGFIQHKAALNNQKINEVITEISQVASSEFDSNSRLLTGGLQSINSQMQEQSRDFKSKVNSTLAAFSIS